MQLIGQVRFRIRRLCADLKTDTKAQDIYLGMPNDDLVLILFEHDPADTGYGTAQILQYVPS